MAQANVGEIIRAIATSERRNSTLLRRLMDLEQKEEQYWLLLDG
jgi:hypothetical protein